MTAESEVHIGRTDTDEAVSLALGVLCPAQTVETQWLRDDFGVARQRASSEADVDAFGED